METPRDKSHTPPHAGDGAWRPSMAYLVVAAVLVACGIGYWLLSADDANPPPSVASAPQSAAPSEVSGYTAWPLLATVFGSPTPAAAQESSADKGGTQDPTPDLSDYVPKGSKPTMNEVIERLHKEGIHTGLGAFNPPGTRPPKIGLAVPEGYQLPEGYVRHYQSTDDGQRIEPILMFAPDKQIFDANNKPIEIPADRVVPPELAPPGFPIRRIEIPPPLDSGR